MTHRILLADDSATIRKVVELTFSDEDFALDSVGDGSQAFEHARAQRPDVVISDVSMPGLNGYELCRRFKADPDLRSVPFLFLKGTFESFDEDRARSCGADGFIVKPFESQEMIAKVKDLIGRAAAAPPSSPVAALPTPIPAAVRPTAAREVPGTLPAAPRPDNVIPRPVVQQRPAMAPPPIPTVQIRPAPAPPAIPFMSPRPAPPVPQWPTRPVPVMAPSAPQPLQQTTPIRQPAPQPPVHQAPPPVHPPPPPPVYQPPAPPIFQTPPPLASPAAAKAPVEDFSFDFGEAEDDRFGAPPAQTSASKGTAPPLEPSGESDEDLWSEVSLRGSTTDLLEDRERAGSGVESGADIVDLTEDTAIIAPEVLFEDEAVFEEVSTARMIPLAPVVEPAEALEETPLTTADLPAVSRGTAAPIAIDQAEIERIVSSRMEAAIRQVLEPIVGDLARTMIESIAWEVIPDLADAMIRTEIERIRQSTRTD